MKAHMWILLSALCVPVFWTGCSGSDSPPPPDSSIGAQLTDTFAPASDTLTPEEESLVNSGEAEPESRKQRDRG
jgi:PBP1b-binding outer membrane lipoprotein LpoB